MATITKEVRLICSDIISNNNKFYYGRYFDDGTAESEYGRVGLSGQVTHYPTHAALDAKVRGKAKKGYTELKTVATSGVSSSVHTVQKGDLLDIASQQIKTSSPALNAMIKRLVEWNIHQITSATNVTYNSVSGLFETPLGVVTMDGITEARDILSDSVGLLNKGDYGAKMVSNINQFLRIVPSNIGMKRLEPRTFFPDLQSIQKQNDILDSLEASYKALQAPVKTDGDKQNVLEQVFKVRLDAVTDAAEIARIQKKYKDTRKDTHVCAHLNVKNVFEVEIEDNVMAFEQGSKVGEIMELWHGTKKANVLSILKSGLQVSPPSTASIAGKMYGNGIYFAIHSTKSLNYSYGYWDGKRENNCFMFIAKVALGKYHIPKGSYGSFPHPGSDSTWAKSGQSGVINDEIIVYNNRQFKLTHLVEFA